MGGMGGIVWAFPCVFVVQNLILESKIRRVPARAREKKNEKFMHCDGVWGIEPQTPGETCLSATTRLLKLLPTRL